MQDRDLKDTPIALWQDLPGGPSAMKPYGHSIGFDSQDPRWNEPLVDLASHGLLTKSWYAVNDGSNPPYNRKIKGALDKVLLRTSAANRCVIADQWAQSAGLRLLFVDGYRSEATQKGLYKFFEDNIRDRKPHLTAAELRQETLVYVTPGDLDPENPQTWFVHATGGSIDVLLYDEKTSEILDCGVGFDNDTPVVFTDHYERLLSAGKISDDEPALMNRRILYNAMTKAGFTNYPYEYFHFDYGTIIHSVRKNIEQPDLNIKAWYGLALSPT